MPVVSLGSGVRLLNASWGPLHCREDICARFFLVTYSVCLSLIGKVQNARAVWEQKLRGARGPR